MCLQSHFDFNLTWLIAMRPCLVAQCHFLWWICEHNWKHRSCISLHISFIRSEGTGEVWCRQKAALPTSAFTSRDSPAYNTRPSHHRGEVWERGEGQKIQRDYIQWNIKSRKNKQIGIKHIDQTLTINIVWSEVDLYVESFVGVFDGGQCEVGQGLLGEVRHHSLWKSTCDARSKHVCNSRFWWTRHTLTVDLEPGEGLHFPLFVGGRADVGARVLMGDPRNCQHVGLLETLGRKLSLHLQRNNEKNTFQHLNIKAVLQRSGNVPIVAPQWKVGDNADF